MKRLLIRSAVVLVPVACVAALMSWRLGAWLVVEDPLEKADAIFVLGGTRAERSLEAFDLYKEGWAPRIMLFQVVKDFAEVELLKRGVAFPLESDVQRDVLHKLGVPKDSVVVLGEKDSTRMEAFDIRAVSVSNGWKTIIVVTSKQHTRRARLAVTRRLHGTGVKVIMRASRYDLTDVEHWWRARSSLRFTLFETQRLLGYWIGIAD